MEVSIIIKQNVKQNYRSLYQRLSRGQKDRIIIKYGFVTGKKTTTFFRSFEAPLCFIALIVCVCIVIYGLNYVNGDFQRSKKESENPRLPNKPFEAKDQDAEQQRREQKTFCV